MPENYDDIIHLSRPKSEKHPPMSMLARAAQFSPFAALTGYEAAVKETARLTDERIEVDDGTKEILNEKLRFLLDNPQIEAMFTYFQPDKRKAGGAYVNTAGYVKEINPLKREIILTNGTKIPIEEIIGIESAAFSRME